MSVLHCDALYSVSRGVDRDVLGNLFLVLEHRSFKHGTGQRLVAGRARDGSFYAPGLFAPSLVYPDGDAIGILVLRASLAACRFRSFLACPDAVVLSFSRSGCLPLTEIPWFREASLSRRIRCLATVLHLSYFAASPFPWAVDSRLQRHVHLEIHMDFLPQFLVDLFQPLLADLPRQ